MSREHKQSIQYWAFAMLARVILNNTSININHWILLILQCILLSICLYELYRRIKEKKYTYYGVMYNALFILLFFPSNLNKIILDNHVLTSILLIFLLITLGLDVYKSFFDKHKT